MLRSSDLAENIIHVQDEGIGIPLAGCVQVFEGFHRGSNVGGIPGAGLGLASGAEGAAGSTP